MLKLMVQFPGDVHVFDDGLEYCVVIVCVGVMTANM